MGFRIAGDDEVDVVAELCDAVGNFHKDVESARGFEPARDLAGC